MSERDQLNQSTKSYSKALKAGLRDYAGTADDLPGNWPYFTITVTLAQIVFFIYFYVSYPEDTNKFNRYFNFSFHHVMLITV